MKNWMAKLLNFKILMLMYFAGFLFVYLVLDLVWWRVGAIPTATCWQMLLAAVLLAAIHFAVFECGFPAVLRGKKGQFLLHFGISYTLLLALMLFFGWISHLTLMEFLLYTGLFSAAYVGLCFAFSIYYSVERSRMNGKLELFKQNSGK